MNVTPALQLVPRKIVYEQPLNERIRTFLRLEFLFNQAQHNMLKDSVWTSRSALISLVDILVILERGDVKTEVLKEMDRHALSLARLARSPGVDQSRLAQILDRVQHLGDRLRPLNGPIGQELKKNEFLKSIAQRTTIPGGTCHFDLPGYHFWLERPTEQRTKNLANWLTSFETLQEAIALLLTLIRQSVVPTHEHAPRGFFQQSLDPNLPYQLLRVSLPASASYFPEISGGKHRFTVRFLEQPCLEMRAVQTAHEVDFELARCAF